MVTILVLSPSRSSAAAPSLQAALPLIAGEWGKVSESLECTYIAKEHQLIPIICNKAYILLII